MSTTPQLGSDIRILEIEAEVADLYNSHCVELLRYAEGILSSPDEARDAVQELYLRYFVERRFGREMENPRTWLFHALRSQCLDRLKATESKREVVEGELDRIPDNRHDPEKILQRRELAKQIATRLSGREMACLRLRALGLRYEEVGIAMGVCTGTVGALLARVRAKLRKSRESWLPTDMTDVYAILLEGRANYP